MPVRAFAAAELLVALATVVPCGCFGAGGSRPLGAAGLWLGLLFVAAGTAQTLLPDRAAPSHLTTAVALLTVTASAGWLLSDHHAHARRALLAALDRTEATA